MTLKAMGSPALKDLINVVSLIVTMGQIYVKMFHLLIVFFKI